MKLWAGGKYLLTMPGQEPAGGTANGARTNNARKLLITDSTLTNDIRFLYSPPFATPGPLPLPPSAPLTTRQNLGICLALAARDQPTRAGGESCCTNAGEHFHWTEQLQKKEHSLKRTKMLTDLVLFLQQRHVPASALQGVAVTSSCQSICYFSSGEIKASLQTTTRVPVPRVMPLQHRGH